MTKATDNLYRKQKGLKVQKEKSLEELMRPLRVKMIEPEKTEKVKAEIQPPSNMTKEDFEDLQFEQYKELNY